MANSRIRITFNQDIQAPKYLSFRVFKASDPTLNIYWRVRFMPYRTQPIHVPIGTPSSIIGEVSAINYVKTLNYSFNSSGFYAINRVENVVTIVAPNGDINFDRTDDWTTLPPEVTVEFLNSDDPAFIIDDVDFLPATNNPVCSHYKVRVNTSLVSTIIHSPTEAQTNTNTNQIFEFEILRAKPFNLSVENDNGLTAQIFYPLFQVPPVFSDEQISASVISTPTGATINISVVSTNYGGISYTYSINGVNFQNDNTFTVTDNGDYTIYVKDSLGCIKTIDVSVTSNNVRTPYTYVSESNSIRFAKRVTPSNCGVFMTDHDRLSNEERCEDKTLCFTWHHPINSCDESTIQFKSNYEVVRANVVLDDGSTDSLVVSKRTNNIGIKDKRDARKYSLPDGKTGIYFVSGNIYDYDSGLPDGTYTLNGGLTEYSIIGNYISVDDSWFQISSIVYDETIQAEVIVLDSNYSGNTIDVVVASKFNRHEYEVYEFLFIASSYNDKIVRLNILHEDPNFENVEYLSELIDVSEDHKDTICIEYWNDKNTDVFYKSGIKFKCRFPLLSAIPGDEGEQDSNKSDINISLQSLNMYDTIEFNFDAITKGIYRMLTRALSHKFVYIDGEGYIKNGNFDSEIQNKSNLMTLKATMIKTNRPYTTEVTGLEPTIVEASESLSVPNLIIPDDDQFIGY